MKDMVTDLNYPNELVMFSRSILGKFFFKNIFGVLEARISPLVDSYNQSDFI